MKYKTMEEEIGYAFFKFACDAVSALYDEPENQIVKIDELDDLAAVRAVFEMASVIIHLFNRTIFSKVDLEKRDKVIDGVVAAVDRQTTETFGKSLSDKERTSLRRLFEKTYNAAENQYGEAKTIIGEKPASVAAKIAGQVADLSVFDIFLDRFYIAFYPKEHFCDNIVFSMIAKKMLGDYMLSEEFKSYVSRTVYGEEMKINEPKEVKGNPIFALLFLVIILVLLF